MKPLWIIEEFNRDNSFLELEKVAKKFGHKTKLVKYVGKYVRENHVATSKH